MGIPSSIDREHVLAAMRELSENGWPVEASSTKFDVVAPDGSLLPPKLVISVAARNATGNLLSRQDFSGGMRRTSAFAVSGSRSARKPTLLNRCYRSQISSREPG